MTSRPWILFTVALFESKNNLATETDAKVLDSFYTLAVDRGSRFGISNFFRTVQAMKCDPAV
jgi:hypothetical protein